MHEAPRELLVFLADTVDRCAPYTGGHSRRVTAYCAQILTELQVTRPERALILWAARVHDSGKIAIPDAVLNKAGALTPKERADGSVRRARGGGAAAVQGRRAGVAIVRHHHAAWGGSGYRHRLKGTQIPFGARVMAVADSYDAMTSDWPYRQGMAAATGAGTPVGCPGRRRLPAHHRRGPGAARASTAAPDDAARTAV